MKKLVALFVLLLTLACCTTEADRTRMRAALDSINQRNRNDQPFTVQDVEPYVQFFDRHGTPNDRLLAHYLLGRAYHEQGEAPMALECYQKAAECADTTSKDCDYRQLCRVYGQMSDIFYYQGLFHYQLKYLNSSVKFAWMAKDTLSSIVYYEHKNRAFKKLGEVDSVIRVCENAASLYQKYGYPRFASCATASCISSLLDKREFEKAKRYIDVYEKQSMRFNENGDIEHGREFYYNIKGYFFLLTNRLDSAEFYFRKELSEGKDLNNQYSGAKGLSDLYELRHQPDSIAKYALYSNATSDSLYSNDAKHAVVNMQAMYDYSHFQKMAHQESKKANRRKVVIWVISFLFILSALIVYMVIYMLNQNRRELERKYKQSIALVNQAREDIAKLKICQCENSEMIAEKEQFIREQKTVQQALLQKGGNNQQLAEKELKDRPVYLHFEQMAFVGKEPTEDEWKQIQDAVFDIFPGFCELLTSHKHLLNDKEFKTCILARIKFRPNSIANMLGTTASYISILRSGMMVKLFNQEGTPKEFDRRIRGVF